MIKLSYTRIVTTPLVPALQKLTNLSVFDGKTAYRLHKIHEKIKEHYIKSMLEFDDLGVKYGEKDDKGECKKTDQGKHIPLEGKEKEYAEALNKFFETEFEVSQHKVHIDSLTTRFSPQEIAALIPIIDGLE